MSLIAHALHGGPAEGPRIAALDRGLQLGDGVFDTLTAFSGTAFALDRHLARLVRSAAAIGIIVEEEHIGALIAEVLAGVGARHAIIRTTVTRGAAGRGLWPATVGEPTILVTAQPWTADLAGQPARLVASSIRRNEHSPLSRLKSLAYLDNILAAREAAAAGADDAVLLNTAGRVACTTIANLFALTGDRLLTPPAGDGALDGIVRGLVLEDAGALGLRADETSLTVDDLAAADAVFLTNSVRLVRPVTAIGDRAIPSSPWASRVMERLAARVAASSGLGDDALPPLFTAGERRDRP